MRGSDDKNHLA